MAKFGTFNYGDGTLFSGVSGQSSELVRVPWWFRAGDSEDEYEFAVNPITATMPEVTKTFSKQKTSAGANVIFQGRNAVQTLNFSGTILTQEHYEIMKEWVSVEKQILIIDDLDRKFWTYLTSFNPQRMYSPEYPWRHEYSCDGVLLSWV